MINLLFPSPCLGKKHQYNLQRRAVEQAREAPSTMQPERAKIEPKKFIKIGRPGYKVSLSLLPDTTWWHIEPSPIRNMFSFCKVFQ